MSRHIDGAIAERSRTQLGLIQREQVLRLGLTESQIRRRVSSGALEVPGPRVLRIAGAPVTWEQLLLAGLLGLGEAAVVSHMSAAALWHLEGVRPTAVELTVPRGHRNRISVGRVHSSLHLPAADIARQGTYRLTAPARTIVDIASRVTHRQLEGIVDAACRDRLTSEEEILERAIALRRPGRSKLMSILGADAPTGRPHTWLEREALRIFQRAEAPLPKMQTVLDASGRVVRADGCFEVEKLVLEFAGHRTHSTRRQRQDDNERRLRLEEAGYRVLEFTYEDVTQRPEYVLETTLVRLALPH